MAASCHRDPVCDEKHCKGERIGSGSGLRGIKCHSGEDVALAEAPCLLTVREMGSRDGKRP